MKTIGVIGDYENGNFGDDLMAYLIWRYLSNLGYNTVTSPVLDGLVRSTGIQATDSVGELIDCSDVLILGGGCCLMSNSYLRRNFSRVGSKFERSFEFLNRCLTQSKKPVFCVSIGGDGNGHYTFSRSRSRFFKSQFFMGGTVRLEQDLSFERICKKEFLYFPDILLSVDDFFAPRSKKFGTFTIGINLISKDLDEIVWLKKLDSIFEVKYLQTHLPESGMEYEYSGGSSFSDSCVYDDLFFFMEEISGLDLVISSKLHIGLVAMAFGVPFISYKGREKTKAFLRSIGAGCAIVEDSRRMDSLVEEIKNHGIGGFAKHTKSNEFVDAKIRSRGHLKFLERIVQGFGLAK